MSNRPSSSPPPDSLPSSPPPSTHSDHLEDFVSTTGPPMIHVGRPTPIAPPYFSALHSHHTPRSSQPIPLSLNYSTTSTRQTTTTSSRHATTPESMRASEHGRGLKRARSEDVEDEEEERQGSVSGSEDSEHAEQPIMPAPKKRTRTLMTPDQLTALHRLLSQTRFPTTEQREQCGREIGLSARRVQVSIRPKPS
ncbi:homeobox domain protein [Rhizoctonia solani AG-3 Rhs1AP]|uniref:Homeobox domain protein n=2 Tax=Rhizoctonia solani AG-3 TaxID=1086053 RepID=A0A074RUJ0_9AGAM|nr:homeobox domain protein [Rhizoctonia solani AG-3 Rhs1AP]KEP48288.1 homeobox domain protein [Rhizoctonia solani 123E]